MIGESNNDITKRMKACPSSPTGRRIVAGIEKSSAGSATPEQLLTIEQAAQVLACSQRQVWRLMNPKRKELERVEIGGMTRTTLASVLKLIQRSKT